MKLKNDYARCFGRLYDSTPKAVFAAIAASFIINHLGKEDPDEIQSELLKEWNILNQNGLIPQTPPKNIRP